MKTRTIKIFVTHEYKVRLHDGAELKDIMADLKARIKRGTTELGGGGEYGFSQGRVVDIKEAE